MSRLLIPLVVVLILAATFLLSLPEDSQPPSRLERVRDQLAALTGRGGGSASPGLATSLLQDRFALEPLTPAELRAAWRNDDPIVRWAGWLAIESYGTPDDGLWDALRDALRADEAYDVRAAAALAANALAGHMPGRLRDLFVGATQDADAAVRAPAYGVLVALAPTDRSVWSRLAEALVDPEPACRERAANALAKVPFSDASLAPGEAGPIVARLHGALEDEREATRMYATMALGRMGSAAAPAIPGLVALLRGESALLQGHAATALGRIGEPALAALTEAAQRVPARQIPMVMWAIRLVGKPAEGTLRDVMTSHPIPAARVVAAMKLWELDHPFHHVAPAFEAALRGDLEAQRQAARGLERIGPAASAMAPHLRAARKRVGATATDPAPLRRALDAALRSVTR